MFIPEGHVLINPRSRTGAELARFTDWRVGTGTRRCRKALC